MASALESLTRRLRGGADWIQKARVVLFRALFEVDERSLPRARRILLGLVRLTFVTVDSFFRERLQMRAAALSFFTLLSIVPMAALAFAIAKEVGAYDLLVAETVRPVIEQNFPVREGEPVPAGVAVLRSTLEQILDVVAATDVRGLGLAGLVVLLAAIHRVVRATEDSFDAIWGFPGDRRLLRRMPGYVLVTLVTPAALLTSTTATAASHGRFMMRLLNQALPVPWLVTLLTSLVPVLLVCLGILLMYVLLPSARVRRRSAILGALVGGLGWYALSVVHVRFQLGVARANAIYSGFGAFPIFMLWVQLSWVCILLGAQVASAHQNAPTLRQLARRRLGDHVSRQAVALRSLVYLAAMHEPARLRTIAREIGVAVEAVREVLDSLVDHRHLARQEGPYNPIYTIATDPECLRVATVLEAVGRDPSDESRMPWEAADGAVNRVLEGLASAAAESAHNQTIGELGRSAVERASRPSVLASLPTPSGDGALVARETDHDKGE